MTMLLSLTRTLIVLSVSAWVTAGPIVNRPNVRTSAGQMKYLEKFGYLTGGKGVKDAMKRFQKMYGLSETGEMDEASLQLMEKPRCGVPDVTPSRRDKRYALNSEGWPRKHLTYTIQSFPKASPVSQQNVRDTLAQAFKFWSDVSQLTFEEKNEGIIDIIIKFVVGDHGDVSPFEGPGGVLAHAFSPLTLNYNIDSIHGDAHFDDSETWTINTYAGINLLQVAVHEFGHSLGLSHSDVQDAIMFAYYRGYVPDMKLHEDDKQGIQALYGAPETTTPAPTPSTTQTTTESTPTSTTETTTPAPTPSTTQTTTESTSTSSTETTTPAPTPSTTQTTTESTSTSTTETTTPAPTPSTTQTTTESTSTSTTPSATPPTDCEVDFVKMEDRKRQGYRLKYGGNSVTLQQCKRQCSSRDICWAFTYSLISKNSNSKCYLYQLNLTNDYQVNFYAKIPYNDGEAYYRIYEKKEESSDEYDSIHSTQEDCEAKCSEEKNCIGYSYPRNDSDNCKLYVYATRETSGINTTNHYVKNLSCRSN